MFLKIYTYLLATSLFAFFVPCGAQKKAVTAIASPLTPAQGFDATYQAQHSETYVQDKNFYLLTLFQESPAIKAAFQQDAIIQAIWLQKKKSLEAVKLCTGVIDCDALLFSWSDQERDLVGKELKQLATADNTFQELVTHHLRPSGLYAIYGTLDNGALLQQAWVDACNSINRIIQVYALGAKPLYPAIDSASYPVQSRTYARLLHIAALQIVAQLNKDDFFEPSLHFALSLLEINNRDEAGRFEPLETGENNAAVMYAQTMDWTKYPYTLILVPGAGNDLPNVPLAAWGKMRLKIAVEKFRQGLAPFIAVSGGFVHPFQTPYCEAYEMKRYLMTHYHIPAKAILIEPHARHTTTNIRNVNRLIFRYHFPAQQRVLIVTDQDQSVYIEDKKFAQRCMQEMKCVPYKDLIRVSQYDLSYLPDSSALFANSMDPLDP